MPHGYTDSQWRAMGIKNVSMAPAAIERMRDENPKKVEAPVEAPTPEVPVPEAPIEKKTSKPKAKKKTKK